jgi:hypothetical protein
MYSSASARAIACIAVNLLTSAHVIVIRIVRANVQRFAIRASNETNVGQAHEIRMASSGMVGAAYIASMQSARVRVRERRMRSVRAILDIGTNTTHESAACRDRARDNAMTFDDIVAASRARLAARDRIASSNPRPLLFDVRHARGKGSVLVHRCCVRPGEWRVTSFDRDEPTGHIEVETFADAIREAYQVGADMLSAKDPL